MAERKYVLLTSFRVCARLVAYGELRGSGVRVPSEGLSVTGAIWEAMSYLPSPALRQDHIDDTVISHSSSRDKGFEFVPEGLGKLGLCMPPPASETLTPDVPPPENEEEESDVLLTPIGRAAVEMVWLGCLALTSFGP
ncbi:hypothetical protein SERLADRAFT_387526 [Serpula lacrymans var. lacrymans S7.9]|nr:uncharacterized protein SERLADRAFT_387526 [Serpula lacrymans var. lacrymans S7.9]EGO25484.1 hypothetical protein SERLADRAFT_387526 [Serpula lacrymans var. lacrymans S7.9]